MQCQISLTTFIQQVPNIKSGTRLLMDSYCDTFSEILLK